MEEYLQRREQLIREDRSLRIDSLRGDSLTDLEAKADQIVRDIRSAEARSVWGHESKSIFEYDPEDKSPNVFPGMDFLTARDTIVHTRMFKILCKMPKGALLHAHLDATVNARVLLGLALTQPAMHVKTSVSVAPGNLKSALPEFQALAKSHISAHATVAEGYVAGEWVQIQQARENFPAALGGPQGFDNWVIGALTINPSEAYVTHNTTSKIWAKFTGTFKAAHGLIHYAPTWTEYIRQFFLSSIQDGISYVEARINFLRDMIGPNGEERIPHREWLVIYDRVLNEVKEDMRKQGRSDEFLGSKIIYVTIRFVTPAELKWYLEDCIALKKEFPHLIAGFDLVGHEDSLKPLIDYLEPLMWFQQRQKEEGVDIPFIFHAGETLGDGTPADVNLYDAILLGTKRIGHGFSLAKHPKLIEICKERGIAVEMCPISNEILRLTSSMPMHPLPVLMNQGVHVALCSDDPAVFGNMGLSYDFFQVMVASDVTGLVTMGEFAKDSIKHSMLDEEEKKVALAAWQRQWTKFLEWVVAEGAS